MEYIINIIEQIYALVNEMSPYLLLGFLIAGILHSFVPSSVYSRYLSRNNLSSVINAAIFGVPLPLCSCGVIPTAMSLRREGASRGATVSFLIATPQTGVDSIFATYSLMGLPFAIVRPVAALVTAVLGGEFVNVMGKDADEDSSKDSKSVLNTPQDVKNRMANDIKTNGFMAKLMEALNFGFVEMMEDIGKWLVVGLIVAGLITVLVPDSFFGVFKDNTLMSMLLVLCISVPMYLCATGSIPIAVALMMKGLTPGSALVLLMAGPASNAASILVINKVMGRKTLVLYLLAIVAGAIACGCVVDYCLPREWFTSSLMMTKSCCHKEAGWFSIGCTIMLACMLLNVFVRRLLHKGNTSCEIPQKESNESLQTALMSAATVYHIKGMHCNHCKANAEKAIMSVPGVESVEVDLPTGEAKVMGSNFTEDDIRSAIESLGFELN